MKDLVRIELLKLRTTPALYICGAVVAGLTAVSVVANILLAGKNGAAPLGSVENVNKVFSVAALSTMIALAIGIVMVAGEYRHRTIVSTYLGEPRRGRVAVAKLLTAAALGAVTGAIAFGLAVAIGVPMLSARGVHHLPVDVGRMWWGATVASCCFGMLGVALGSATRHAVGAIVGAIIWVQVVEVAVLQPSVPSLAKWLPTGAGVALTSSGKDAAALLSPVPAALVLVSWACALTYVAVRVSLSREVA
jgi:ABC-type transport system involved in multi-copper enzyme maturation permease subunit